MGDAGKKGRLDEIGFLGLADATRGVPLNCSALLGAALRGFDVARLPTTAPTCAGSQADV